jgi:group I intron endonuclease
MITYIATNTKNGKFYIGSTNNLQRRQRQHRNQRGHFQNAYRKNPEVFEWQIWEDEEEEPILEQALLDMWFGKDCCYNLSPYSSRPPGNDGLPLSESTKQKISKKLKGKLSGDKNPSKREEVRAKIAASRRGKPRDKNTRKKIAEGVRGKKHWINANGERKLQAEHPGEGWQRGMKWRA